jgi:hypothetical protein
MMVCPRTDEVSSWRLLSDAIKCSAERPEWPAVSVAAKCAPDCFEISTELDCYRGSDRRVARVAIRTATGPVVRDEHLADPTVSIPANGADVVQPPNFDREVLTFAPV